MDAEGRSLFGGEGDGQPDEMDDLDASRRPWSNEEDESVVHLVHELGTKKWSQIAAQLNGRTGKQCRERWHNQLDPEIKKHNWTPEEESMLVEAHRKFGNKWAKIAACLPGRTDNAIKNHWNSALRRELRKLNRHKGVLDSPSPAAGAQAPSAQLSPVDAWRAQAVDALREKANANAADIGAPSRAGAHEGATAQVGQASAEADLVKTEELPSSGASALAATASATGFNAQPRSLPTAASAAPATISAHPQAQAAAHPIHADKPAAARKRRSVGEPGGPDRDIAKGTKQVLLQNISTLNQLWSSTSNPPSRTDVKKIDEHVSWLQTFCDSLVESSLENSVQLVNKKRKVDLDAQPSSAQLAPPAHGLGKAQLAVALALEGVALALGTEQPSAAGSAAGLAACTPRAKHFSLTPGRGTPFGPCRGTPFGLGEGVLNDLLGFDVDDLLKIVNAQAAGTALVLASPRGKPLVGISPASDAQHLGLSSAARSRHAQPPLQPVGSSRLNQLPAHRLFLSPRTAQQLAPPLKAPDENAKSGCAGGLSATPRQLRSVSNVLLSAARGVTPRTLGNMTPMTPGSARITPDDLLGFLNLDALLTPVEGGGSACKEKRSSLSLSLSPFPMCPMPTPSKEGGRVHFAIDADSPSTAMPMAVSPDHFTLPFGKHAPPSARVAASEMVRSPSDMVMTSLLCEETDLLLVDSD